MVNRHAGREDMVTQALPYLLVKSITLARQSDVKRVHNMRAALPLFDFDDDESIVSLKKLLLRCAFAPVYLRSPEGRRFLSSLFCLQPALTKELQVQQPI
jgi:condensin-2 complex subunit G2